MSTWYSRLFWKAFLSLLLALLVWLPVFYWLTVPLVNRLAYEVEEKAGRAVLDNVVQVVGQSHRDLEAWRQTALEARRRELRNIVLVVESWSRQLEADVAAGRLDRGAARRQLLERLRQIRYGKHDYLWAADYDSVLVSHPDPAMQGRDASALRDAKGKLVIPAMVEQGRRAGEGYFSYWWARLDSGRPAEKLGYFRNLPAWQLVIGTGVYIDDVEQEVARRRADMVDNLRRHLHEVKVAGSGYVFVMDGKLNAIVHPDPQLEGKSMAQLVDAGGQALGAAFIAAAGRPDKTLAYRGARPGDPDGRSEDQVAWVEHLPEHDWYLGASAYKADLGRSGGFLAQRILLAFVFGLAVTAVMAFFFIRTLTAPILRLAAVAQRNRAGDLAAASGIRRNDEIGELAEAFDDMVARLKAQIETLEERVEERTREIAEWAVQLEAVVAVRTAEARASEARFRGLVEQSLAGIVVVQDGRLRYVNPGFARLHGYDDPAQMLGLAPTKLLAPEDVERVAAIDRQLIAGEIPCASFEISGLRRNGSRVAAEAHAYRIDYEGKPAVIVLALDISERRRAEKARDAALAAAESLSRLKSEFLANMSHELRTPLNGVIGLAHVGRRAGDLARAQEACTRIGESGRQLLQLVENVLDFSSLETGRLQLQPAPCDLVRLADEVSVDSRLHARAKGVEFRLELELDASRRYRGDAGRIAQVMAILLDNAVKFTDRGSIVVSLARDGEEVVMSVADTGIGMAAEQLDRLFRPFEQFDASASRCHGGMGLGLALAERLVVLMGGSIRAESVVGAGTTITVRLPLPETAEAASAPAEERDYSI